jgi:hypothetical protein
LACASVDSVDPDFTQLSGEAHRFTAWKGFFIMMIPAVIFGIIVFTIAI